MHAARALNAQRKKRADHRLANVRRLSAASGSRTPISSADLDRLEKAAKRINRRNTGGVNCAYVGFTLAIFGAIPLIVGTFVEVPALWEVGLTITILGLMLGIVYWCMDFMRETKGVGPVIPKPKPQIPIGRMKNLSSKPPICLSTLEKDEVITVEVPARVVPPTPTIIASNKHHRHQKNRSFSEPILENESKQLLQRREPRPFLEFEHEEELKDYLEHEEEEAESKQVSEETKKQEIEVKEEACVKEVKPEPMLEAEKEIKETEMLLASKPEETQSEVPLEPKQEPETSEEKESNEIPDVETLQSLLDSIDRDSPLLAPPPNDTAVQITPESSKVEHQMTSADEEPPPAVRRVSEEKEILQSDLSPVDCEATTPNHPVASSPPPATAVVTVPNTSYNNAIESEFPSVPGVVPDEAIQMVEVVPTLTNDSTVEKKAEEAANE